MTSQFSFPRIPTAIAAGLAAIVLTSGGVTAWLTLNSPAERPVETTDSLPTQTETAQTNPTVPTVPVEQTTTLYWLQDTGTRLELTAQPMTVTAADQPEALLTSTLTTLLAGPGTTTVATTIPAETELLGVDIRADGIHVDLSADFTFGGGSASMSGRLGQILYTATALDADAPVWLTVEGEPLTLLGGEGIVVSQPMTRDQFTANFSL